MVLQKLQINTRTTEAYNDKSHTQATNHTSSIFLFWHDYVCLVPRYNPNPLTTTPDRTTRICSPTSCHHQTQGKDALLASRALDERAKLNNMVQK